MPQPLLERTIAQYRARASAWKSRERPEPHIIQDRLSQQILETQASLSRWTSSGLAMCAYHQQPFEREALKAGCLPLTHQFYELRESMNLPIGSASAFFLANMTDYSLLSRTLHTYYQRHFSLPMVEDFLGYLAQEVHFSWKLAVITATGQPFWEFMLEIDPSGAAIVVPSAGFRCPRNQCTILSKEGEDTVLPCETCGETFCQVFSWMQTASLLLRGDFQQAAPVSSDQQVTRELEQDTGARLQPRTEKPHKFTAVTVTSRYRVMTFDACLKPLPPDRPYRARGSWVEQARAIDPDAVIKVQRGFGQEKPITRTLKGAYWQRVITQMTPQGQAPDLEQGIEIPVAAHMRMVPMRVGATRRLVKQVIASPFDTFTSGPERKEIV